MSLVESLKSFNRKERYWLLQNAIGEKINRLDERFVTRLNKVLEARNVTVPPNAYWALDYHFDWIAGAIAEDALQQNSNRRFENPPDDSTRYRERLVQGNQEDVDLLVAFDRTILMIECKADTSWSNEQSSSKDKRIGALERFIELYKSDVRLIFLIISPGKTSIKADWFELEQFRSQTFLRVERCTADGKASADGTHWQVIGR